MAELFLLLSVVAMAVAIVTAFIVNCGDVRKIKWLTPFNVLVAGMFLASFLMFFPLHITTGDTSLAGVFRAIILSLMNSITIFAFGPEFSIVMESVNQWTSSFNMIFQVWAALLYICAPIFTVGFILSVFKTLSSRVKYWTSYKKDAYIFSELNERSYVLAEDIKMNAPKSVIVFNDVHEGADERNFELRDKAGKKLKAIFFKKDIVVVDYKRHAKDKNLYFFTIGKDENENLNQSLKLIEIYNKRPNTHLYIFSVKPESELLLTALDKGNVKVRRINEVQSLINRDLYENGKLLFNGAKEGSDGVKEISAVVVGMGNHGTEMVKALSWFCQMDGYRVEINAFDKDELAEEKFIALAPELMSSAYNGREIEGEPFYKIKVHSGVHVETSTFADKISELKKATYVFVSLGNDDINISTAINLRMLFERMGIHPSIRAIVYNTQQKNALSGIKNYRGQAYDIEFIGDIATSYTEAVILDSALENEALKRHLKWGKEEEFWTYEYNYRSSIASAIHLKARKDCGITGASKKEEELTEEERNVIEVLEHKRWNAYMRSEGYIYSGSKNKESRNDLAKMHHDLVDFSSLTEEEKRKDSRVGTD